MSTEHTPSRAEIARHLKAGGMGCNCDLDNWRQTYTTGHGPVCRIHKVASAASDALKAEVLAAIALTKAAGSAS